MLDFLSLRCQRLFQGISVSLRFLVSCCALAAPRQLHPWRFELELFPSRLPCGQLYKFRFEANPIWYSSHKVYEIALSEVLATQMGVTEAQHQSQLELTHFCLTAGRFHRNSCIVMLWVACELLMFAAIQLAGMVDLFVDHTHTHSMNNLRWQPHRLPRLTSFPRKSHD